MFDPEKADWFDTLPVSRFLMTQERLSYASEGARCARSVKCIIVLDQAGRHNHAISLVGRKPMFKGKAELRDPEKDTPVATFSETCRADGAAHMKVLLHPPLTISGTERLAIYSTLRDQEVISVTATKGSPTTLHEFEGKSSLGCLADKSEITLTRSPGGPLGTLLIVLGKGTIHEERH
jgi:hypothetical protein